MHRVFLLSRSAWSDLKLNFQVQLSDSSAQHKLGLEFGAATAAHGGTKVGRLRLPVR